MSESNKKTIDAKGLACPKPVILTKKALADGGFDFLEIIVDNAAACENVSRYAEYAGFKVEDTKTEGNISSIIVRFSETAEVPDIPDNITCPIPQKTAAVERPSTVFIASDKMGHGDDELGTLLMRGFLYTLTEMEEPPKKIVFMNSGIKLTVEGSEHLANLKKLEEAGIEIFVCGTCLEFYKLKDSLAIGTISNMYEITDNLLEGRVLTV